MRVLGIDLSLTRTGVGIVDHADPPTARAEIVESKGKRADTLVERDARLGQIHRDVLSYAGRSTVLAVIESGAFSRVGGSGWDRAACWWRIVHSLHQLDIPVVGVAPTTLKKWAADSGRAEKSDVAVAMARMWPAVNAESNDGWDGLALAHIGAQALGWDVPSRAHHLPARAKIVWPDLPERSVA